MMYFKSLSMFSLVVLTICSVIIESAIVPAPELDTPIAGAMYSQWSCKHILEENPNAPSGVYNLRALYSENVIQVYCEMGLNGGGYTFINPTYLNLLSSKDMQAWFTDKQSFLMRIRKTDGTQPYNVLSQLPQYVTIPLKLGLSESNLYATPVNAAVLGSPYLYFGFLPIANASNNNQQGLRVNGQPLTFNNCDKNPNSQITLFSDFREKSPTTYGTTWQSPFCNSLFGAAIDNPSARVMPDQYFMFTETHWGGCACYTQTDARLKPRGILSTTIGFR